MQRNILLLLVAVIVHLAASTNSYAQKNLVVRQVTENALERMSAGKKDVLSFLQKKSKNRTVNVYEFDSSALSGRQIVLNSILPGQLIRVERQKLTKRTETNFTWYGSIKTSEGQIGSLTLTYLNGELAGNLNYRSGNYSILPWGKGAFSFHEIDFTQFPLDDDALGMTDPGKQVKALAPSALDATMCPLRVLVAFTPSAESIIKNNFGYSSLTHFALEALAETNQAYINSGNILSAVIPFELELAASIRVNYTESGNYNTDLSRFQSTNDGYMDEVHTYRNLYAADVNTLIFNNNSACGLASTILANASNAFCVVHVECVLGNYSFAHEIAHLQGCRHNPEVDNSTSPFAYGHGYVYSPGGWRTIMAYNLNGETRIQYFSNPNVAYGFVAMGTPGTHHNARVLIGTANTINNFRNAPATFITGSTGNVINDEAADAIATNEVILQNGFEATGNSEFTARLISCTGPSLAAEASEALVTSETDLKDEGSAITVYPSVTTGPVIINSKGTDLKRTEIFVTDNSGRMLALPDKNVSSTSVTLDLGHLPNGIYFITIRQDQKIISRKVIVTH